MRPEIWQLLKTAPITWLLISIPIHKEKVVRKPALSFVQRRIKLELRKIEARANNTSRTIYRGAQAQARGGSVG
jgi:hypothetical protein